MYVPEHYRSGDPRWSLRIVQDNPLALLTSNRADGAPHASHVPVIVPPDGRTALEDTGEWRGLVLHGHMNRRNPHWSALSDGDWAGLMFRGPGGYISPATYDTWPAVPTWNFTAVHVQGRLRLLEAGDPTLDVVTATASQLEERFGEQWPVESSLDYIRSLAPGVGAFALHVEKCEAMFKLSQEKEGEVRDSVRDWCAHSTRGASNDLAALMRDYYPATASRPR